MGLRRFFWRREVDLGFTTRCRPPDGQRCRSTSSHASELHTFFSIQVRNGSISIGRRSQMSPVYLFEEEGKASCLSSVYQNLFFFKKGNLNRGFRPKSKSKPNTWKIAQLESLGLFFVGGGADVEKKLDEMVTNNLIVFKRMEVLFTSKNFFVTKSSPSIFHLFLKKTDLWPQTIPTNWNFLKRESNFVGK